jgi:hypothetical protein
MVISTVLTTQAADGDEIQVAGGSYTSEYSVYLDIDVLLMFVFYVVHHTFLCTHLVFTLTREVRPRVVLTFPIGPIYSFDGGTTIQLANGAVGPWLTVQAGHKLNFTGSGFVSLVQCACSPTLLFYDDDDDDDNVLTMLVGAGGLTLSEAATFMQDVQLSISDMQSPPGSLCPYPSVPLFVSHAWFLSGRPRS